MLLSLLWTICCFSSRHPPPLLQSPSVYVHVEEVMSLFFWQQSGALDGWGVFGSATLLLQEAACMQTAQRSLRCHRSLQNPLECFCVTVPFTFIHVLDSWHISIKQQQGVPVIYCHLLQLSLTARQVKLVLVVEYFTYRFFFVFPALATTSRPSSVLPSNCVKDYNFVII